MRRLLPLFALVLALPFLQGAGCPYGSPVPVGPPERYEPTLVGMWALEDEDGQVHLVELARQPGEGIEVRFVTDDKDESFAGHVSVVDGARFMSLVPRKGKDGDGGSDPGEAPRYLLVRYEVTVDALTLRVVVDTLFAGEATKPDTQEALAAFLRAHKDAPELYDEPLVMKRVHATAVEAMKRVARLERMVQELEQRLAVLEAQHAGAATPPSSEGDGSAEPGADGDPTHPGAALALAQIASIVEAATLYAKETGELPPTIAAIASRVPVELPPTDPFGHPWIYERNTEGTVIEVGSYGADGAAGGVGADADIVVRHEHPRGDR